MEKNIIEIVTIVVTLILGLVTKKYTNLSSKKIPIQNLLIGIIVAIVEFIITKDFNTALVFSGLAGGGTYDFIKNLKLLFDLKKPQTEINEDTIEELIEEGVVENDISDEDNLSAE